jgi:F0F1-type ATP synthase assembly protein I
VRGDEDYVPAEVRNQRNAERIAEMNGGEGGYAPGGRFGQQDGGRFGGGQQGGDDRGRFGGGMGGGGGGRYGDRGSGRVGRGEDIELPTGPRWKQEAAQEEDAFPPLNKNKAADILAPKKPRDDVVLPPVEAPLTLPGEDEAAARARIERKKREAEERAVAERKAAEEAEEQAAAEKKEAAEKAARAAALESKLLNEFISGNKLGGELRQWCADQGAVLPTVGKLIFYLLAEKEQKNPDPECAWAGPDKYGDALSSLVEDKAKEQMQVLWAIQKYCNTQGFPKINDEYLVQAMFRAMYKHDLTEPDAFELWKEDESEENSQGKVKAVIQTMDWFTWLEEDEDEEEEEEEEEEE